MKLLSEPLDQRSFLIIKSLTEENHIVIIIVQFDKRETNFIHIKIFYVLHNVPSILHIY